MTSKRLLAGLTGYSGDDEKFIPLVREEIDELAVQKKGLDSRLTKWIEIRKDLWDYDETVSLASSAKPKSSLKELFQRMLRSIKHKVELPEAEIKDLIAEELTKINAEHQFIQEQCRLIDNKDSSEIDIRKAQVNVAETCIASLRESIHLIRDIEKEIKGSITLEGRIEPLAKEAVGIIFSLITGNPLPAVAVMVLNEVNLNKSWQHIVGNSLQHQIRNEEDLILNVDAETDKVMSFCKRLSLHEEKVESDNEDSDELQHFQTRLFDKLAIEDGYTLIPQVCSDDEIENESGSQQEDEVFRSPSLGNRSV